MNKTNAMRRLDAAKINYEALEYIPDESDLSGTHVAEQIGLPPDIVFKTITARGDKTGIIVLCVPSDSEIDLKAAAASSGNKRVELVHVNELLALTGYIRGGCSPVGMKKQYPTYIDETASRHEKITVSAGVRGAQLLIAVADIIRITNARLAPLTHKTKTEGNI